MKKIAFAFIAAMAVLSFAGCKKKDNAKEAMAKMEGFKTAMCACKAGDKACAEKVEKDMKTYSDAMKGKGDKDAKVSEEDTKKMMATMTEYAKCQQTAMGTDPAMAPPADPGAAPPADPGAAPPADPGAAPPAGGDMKEEPKK
jgi:hypothetical protein